MVKAWLVFCLLLIPTLALARTTPNDIYQQRKVKFSSQLAKVIDQTKRQKILDVTRSIAALNQTSCNRFDLDINKLSAILEEEKSRQHVTKTIVAYGQGNTSLDSAAYYLNFAAEAVAFQKAQDYTPSINPDSPQDGLSVSVANLKSDLEILQVKMIKAKVELKQALDYYEK